MIVFEAPWEDKAGIAKIMQIINLGENQLIESIKPIDSLSDPLAGLSLQQATSYRNYSKIVQLIKGGKGNLSTDPKLRQGNLSLVLQNVEKELKKTLPENYRNLLLKMRKDAEELQ